MIQLNLRNKKLQRKVFQELSQFKRILIFIQKPLSLFVVGIGICLSSSTDCIIQAFRPIRSLHLSFVL